MVFRNITRLRLKYFIGTSAQRANVNTDMGC